MKYEIKKMRKCSVHTFTFLLDRKRAMRGDYCPVGKVIYVQF